ncbi:MAG TPA: hypothetical protein VFA04_20945 [Bryobacteraceae bacterium]|nr:hypothetical protein [Bryobacteraceae bacterium]
MDKFADKISYFRFQVLPGESQEEFDALLAEYGRAYGPSGIHERFLVDDMARAHWKIVRMHRVAELVRAHPKAAATAARDIATNERTLRRAHKHLLEFRKLNGRPEKDTPERRALRDTAMQGRLPANIARRPTLDMLFGNSDPFVSRA